MGGECLNSGCVPSKALLAAARAGMAARCMQGEAFGVRAGAPPEIVFAEVRRHIDAVIASIAPHDSEERFTAMGVRVLRARARFTSRRDVVAGTCHIRARRIAIATGSRFAMPSIAGLERVDFLTNETVFSLPHCPRHLLILGAGAMGCEMAQAFRRLGAEVTQVERGRALAGYDRDCAGVVLDQLRAEGVRLIEEAEAVKVEQGTGGIALALRGHGVIVGSHLLLATGRCPSLQGLGLGAAGIRNTDRGITVDSALRTSNRRVFAIGDVTDGHPRFTNVAGHHAGIVFRRALLGLPARMGTTHLPHALYTDPGLAQIGLTQAQAVERHGARLAVISKPMEGNDRAQTERQTAGMIKVMVVKNRVVGVSIAGHNAGEQIGFWSLAMENRLKLHNILRAVLPYPSYAELGKQAVSAHLAPRFFGNRLVRGVVRAVQRLLP